MQPLQQFAESATCTLNNQPIDCAELADKAKPFIGLGIGLLVFAVIISIAIFVFWLVMLIHAIQNQSKDRTTWIIVLIASFFLGFGLIGALVYLFAEKKSAEAQTKLLEDTKVGKKN